MTDGNLENVNEAELSTSAPVMNNKGALQELDPQRTGNTFPL